MNKTASLDAEMRRVIDEQVADLRKQVQDMYDVLLGIARAVAQLGATAGVKPDKVRKVKRAALRLVANNEAVDGPEPLSPTKIKKIRASLGMSQKEFAKATGVTPVAVYFWEAGKTAPRPAAMSRIHAVALGGHDDESQRHEPGKAAARLKVAHMKPRRKKAAKRRARR